MSIGPEKSLSIAAIAVPFIHLSTCIIFTMGYCAGFGKNIVVMFSPQDLFLISITNVIIIYASTLLIPLLHQLDRTFVTRKNAIPNYRSLPWTWGKSDYVLFAPIFLIAAASLTLSVVSILRWNDPIYISMGWGFALLMNPISMYFSHRWQIAKKFTDPADTLLTLLIISFFMGMTAGYADLSANYSKFKYGIFCKRFAIIRGISEHYLAISPDGTKVIIDKSCTITLGFSPK